MNLTLNHPKRILQIPPGVLEVERFHLKGTRVPDQIQSLRLTPRDDTPADDFVVGWTNPRVQIQLVELSLHSN